MRLEEMEKWNNKDLRERINSCFEEAQEAGTIDRPALLSEAQFYMQELDRRHDSWISLRDLILEIVVIALIGWEINLAVVQGHDEDKLWDKQNAILNNLQSSTNATASLLGQELDLEYTLAINVEYSGFDSVCLLAGIGDDIRESRCG